MSMSLKHELQQLLLTFNKNVDQVYDFINFDEEVMSIALNAVKKADQILTKAGVENPYQSINNSIIMLENIKENESIKPRLQIMVNQCVVLLVSYFSSILEEIFETTLKNHFHKKRLEFPGWKEEFKISLAGLASIGNDIENKVGELVLSQNKDISFQDMKSISRTFKEYVGIKTPDQKDIVNDIIFAQASRHAFVHSGGLVSSKMMNQIKHATPRELKNNTQEGESLVFNEDEIKIIGNKMQKYIGQIISSIECL